MTFSYWREVGFLSSAREPGWIARDESPRGLVPSTTWDHGLLTCSILLYIVLLILWGPHTPTYERDWGPQSLHSVHPHPICWIAALVSVENFSLSILLGTQDDPSWWGVMYPTLPDALTLSRVPWSGPFSRMINPLLSYMVIVRMQASPTIMAMDYGALLYMVLTKLL